MKKVVRYGSGFIVGALCILALTSPILHRNNPNVPAIVTETLLQQARLDLDAPLLEILHLPYYRVLRFSKTTGTVAVYSRLGFRIATIFLDGCTNQTTSVSCTGGEVRYGIGW